LPERVRDIGLKHGDYYANYTFQPTLVLTSPEDVKHVLKKIDEFPKRTAKMFQHTGKIIGPYNLVALNNPQWHDSRSLLNKAFTSNSVFFEPMSKKIDLIMMKWGNQSESYVGHDLQKMTLDILATCIFGLDFDTLNGKFAEPLTAYNHVMEVVFNPVRFMLPWINKIPIPFNTKMYHSLDSFDKYCWEMMDQTKKQMEEKKKNEESSTDNLSIIELMYQNGLDEKSIRDNVSLFFLAGHETTAASLSWIISILSTHPDVQEKARKEVFEKIPDELTYESLKELNYIDGLIKEILRLYPAIPMISGRTTVHDTVIGNVRVPAGTIIDMNLLSMSYDPKIWGDPLSVRPERWNSDTLTKDQRTAWMPFSSGPRICIGMNFSIVEQKIFLVHLLKKFKDIKLSNIGQIKPKIGSATYSLDYDKLVIQFIK